MLDGRCLIDDGTSAQYEGVRYLYFNIIYSTSMRGIHLKHYPFRLYHKYREELSQYFHRQFLLTVKVMTRIPPLFPPPLSATPNRTLRMPLPKLLP